LNAIACFGSKDICFKASETLLGIETSKVG